MAPPRTRHAPCNGAPHPSNWLHFPPPVLTHPRQHPPCGGRMDEHITLGPVPCNEVADGRGLFESPLCGYRPDCCVGSWAPIGVRRYAEQGPEEPRGDRLEVVRPA